MKLLLFEWLSGGGLWEDDSYIDLQCPVLQQGIAMRDHVAADLTRAGVELTVIADKRLLSKTPHQRQAGFQIVGVGSIEELRATLRRQSGNNCFSLMIAPETNHCLERTIQWIGIDENKLVSPDLEFVRWAADKNATCQLLEKRGIVVPFGGLLSEWQTLKSNLQGKQIVIKPRFGAGSEAIQLMGSEFLPSNIAEPDEWRVEQFVVGTPVSVSVLCGIEGPQLLPPTGQLFDEQPIGHYKQADYPLEPDIAKRARSLASRTVEVIPSTRGYIGIDMVISDAGAANDCVIEINPRLTMSYLKLAQLERGNLASRMIEVAIGQTHPKLSNLKPGFGM